MKTEVTKWRSDGVTEWKTARGFSLIEILIAVLILALGLLGLGAVFPVVIREQKTAQDRIGGASAENNIRAYLTTNRAMGAGVDPYTYEPESPDPQNGGQFRAVKVVANFGGWHYFAETWTFNTWINDWRERARAPADYVPPQPGHAGLTFQFSPDAMWETNFDWTGVDGVLNEYLNNGNMTFPFNIRTPLMGPAARDAMSIRKTDESVVARDFPLFDRDMSDPTYAVRFPQTTIPLGARLNPSGAPEADNPGYVWDMAIRRRTPQAVLQRMSAGVDEAALESTAERLAHEAAGLQVAVFVRRVDPGIRTAIKPNTTPATRYSLREAFLSTNIAGADRRLPLGEEAGANNNPGPPTQNGTNGRNGVRYSLMRTVDAEFNIPAGSPNAARRDTIEISTTLPAAEWSLLRQVGQRVVDNLGNIYTVVGSKVEANIRTIRVDPPVPPSVIPQDDPLFQDNPNSNNPPYTVNGLRELVFTPQVPAAVFVMEINP